MKNRFRDGFYVNIFNSDDMLSISSMRERENNNKYLLVNGCGIDEFNDLELDRHTYRPDGRVDYQMIYIKEGCGRFFVDGEYKTLNKNSIVIFKPGEIQDYTYFASIPTTVCWIHFTGHGTDELLKSSGINECVVSLDTEFQDFYSISKKIVYQLQIKNDNFEEVCTHYLHLLIILLGQFLSSQKLNRYIPANQKISEIRKYMSENYTKEISMDKYAEMCAFKTNYFIQIFKKINKITPQKYITRLRILKALELLSESGMGVMEVAQAVGYNDPYYFSRVFKKETGVSPRAYRRSN